MKKEIKDAMVARLRDEGPISYVDLLRDAPRDVTGQEVLDELPKQPGVKKKVVAVGGTARPILAFAYEEVESADDDADADIVDLAEILNSREA